jgi:hypothetical protein
MTLTWVFNIVPAAFFVGREWESTVTRDTREARDADLQKNQAIEIQNQIILPGLSIGALSCESLSYTTLLPYS